MTINNGGPQGSNILETHPTHRKLTMKPGEQKKKPTALQRKQAERKASQTRKERTYGLSDLPEGIKENFLVNIITAHSHRIPFLTSSDLKTAFKSLHGVLRRPEKIIHKDEPAIYGFLPGRPTPFTITVREAITALS